jgi:uracil-DNA glycosylase family 4
MLQKPSSCAGCALFEPPYGKPWGFVPASGDGSNGVLIVLEAAGEDEENAGTPVVGKAGQYLWSQLQRVGIEREGFRIHNCLSCRPPENKLIKQPYTEAALAHCAPNLDATLQEHREQCRSRGQTPVVLALGRFAAKRVMLWHEHSPQMKEDFGGYPHWSHTYGCWVMCAPHPSHIMQGNHHLADMLRFCVARALDIATNGLTIEEPPYLLDPSPKDWHLFVEEFLDELKQRPTETFLSYDIETPFKRGRSEEALAKEDRTDYTILRCSFCWKPGHAASVPWKHEYFPGFIKLFTSGGYGLGWNSEGYDLPRVRHYIPKFNLVSLDGMLGWHVLHTAMAKGLGFVTPLFWHTCAMWKHLASPPKDMDREAARRQEAYYNAKDADAALRCWIGIREGLVANHLYPVFETHVMKVNEVLRYMTGKGVVLDLEARQAAEVKVAAIQDSLKAQMDAVVPLEARALKVFKKTPKDTTGMLQTPGQRTTTQCPQCLALDVKADHYKSTRKATDKCAQCQATRKKHCDLDEPGLDHPANCPKHHHQFQGPEENPCVGLKSVKLTVPAPLWAQPQEFKLSIKSLTRYQALVGHKPILKRKEKTPTFDETAIKLLRQQYPRDPLYPLILDFRESQTMLSRYIGRTVDGGGYVGGMQVTPDRRIHCVYTHNPSTLRLASQSPNMQNLPRPQPKNPEALGNLIRNLIVPSPGWVLGARDFSGIEAVLVGKDAMDRDYTRLALRDVHSFYTAYALYEVEKIFPAKDLPDLNWDDDRLFEHLAWVKKTYKTQRNNLYKHLVHAINFGQGAKGAKDKIYEETGIIYDTKLITKLMDLYKALFPRIKAWQDRIRVEADEKGFLRNDFGYIHRFNHVFKWQQDRWGIWTKLPGDDAEAVLAFRPQSNASGIMKKAMLRLYFDRFEEAGQYMRLTTHDELLWECPPELMSAVDAVYQQEMERPVEELPLPPDWNMGPYLIVNTEAKYGDRWGVME